MSEVDDRLADEIDDRVAEAFDAYLAERLAAPGPLRTAARATRLRALVVLATTLMGAAVTLLASPGVLVGCAVWVAIALTNTLVLTWW